MLSIDMKFEADNSFSLDGGSFSLHTGLSFSSTSSGHRPTSGRSTPASQACSTDFDRAFLPDDRSYDFTPPFSQASVDSYFQMELAKSCPSMDRDYDIMIPNGMPVTPTRFDSILDHTVASQTCFDAVEMTPPQLLDSVYSLAESLVSRPFMLPTPEQQQLSASVLTATLVDRSDMWSTFGDADDTPIDFFPITSVVPSNTEPSKLLSPPLSFGLTSNPASVPTVSRRLFVGDAQQRTETLQRHLNGQRLGYAFPQLRSQLLPRSTRLKSDCISKQRRGGRMPRNGSIFVEPKPRFFCDVPGCPSKGYKRIEHLNRHWNVKHNPNAPISKCEFCKKIFTGRNDNYLSHLKLHEKHNKGPNGRTDPHGQEASKVMAAERQKLRGLCRRY